MLQNRPQILYPYLKVGDVATMLNMGKRWVYDHWVELGGSKIGGTIIFTTEGVYHAISGGQVLEGNTKIQGNQGKNKAMQNQTRSLRVGKNREKEAERDRIASAKRHGLINDDGEIS